MQKVTYIYSGETQTFYFNFPYIEKSNIVVTVDGKPAPAYNVIGINGGLNPDFPFSSGKIVFVKPLKMFQSITIERHLPYKRPVDFQPTEKITPMDINLDMNNTLELLKDLKDEVDDLREKYENITDSEKIDTVLEKIDLVNTKIATFAEQLQILERVPGMEGAVALIQSTIESINATISEITSSLSTLNTRTESLLDYVVDSQLPTAENNYTWYRKYKSGWVEQGGHYEHNNIEKTVTTTFIIAMADTHYNLHITKELDSASDTDTNYQFISSWVKNSKTTTSFQTRMTANNRLSGYDWRVEGMSAQE